MANLNLPEYEYRIGQKLGLRDIIDYNDVRWFILIGIEADNELPIAWFYLASENRFENTNISPFGPYAEMVESVSDRFVIE